MSPPSPKAENRTVTAEGSPTAQGAWPRDGRCASAELQLHGHSAPRVRTCRGLDALVSSPSASAVGGGESTSGALGSHIGSRGLCSGPSGAGEPGAPGAPPASRTHTFFPDAWHWRVGAVVSPAAQNVQGSPHLTAMSHSEAEAEICPVVTRGCRDFSLQVEARRAREETWREDQTPQATCALTERRGATAHCYPAPRLCGCGSEWGGGRAKS